jgi:hypothetical protein
MIKLVRSTGLAASLVLVTAGLASAQRSRGTLGVPRVSTTPPPSSVTASPPSSGRGVLRVPRYDAPSAAAPQGSLPRIVTHQGSGYIRGRSIGYGTNGSGYRNGSNSGTGSGFGTGASMSGGFGHRFEPGSSRRWRPGYTRWGVGCGTCVSVSFGGRSARFLGSFSVGYPLFVPFYFPYFYGYSTAVERYVEPVVEEPYVPAPESERAASRLIVIGGGSVGGGDALTVETAGDTVRLSWLGANRPAREVRLFVADSAQRQLATRSASPAAPTATFEVATLSAPVAFAGVTVTFVDGVTTTTMVPYRAGSAVGRPR